jgi:DNA-binding transcriptional LysR family regulator
MNFDGRVLSGTGVLAAIVQSGSFAAAAKTLKMSQSGVSRAVARLETRLGIRLLERTTRSVTLTDDGKRFYEQIWPLISGIEELASSILDGRNAVQGRLRVKMHPVFSYFLQGALLKAFLEKHPKLQLELVLGDRLGDVVGEGFDLAIFLGDPPLSGLIAKKLWDTRILTVAAPSYLKRRGRPKTPQELMSGEHFVIDFRNPENGRPFNWEFHRGRKMVKVPTNGQLIVSDIATLHNTCLAGYGIAQVMDLAVKEHIRTGRMVELFPDWPDERFALYALYPSRSHLPAKTRALLDFVTTLFSDTDR